MNLLKSLVRSGLKVTPYEVCKKRPPAPTFNLVAIALAYLMQIKRQPTFVQIGACDGVSGDPIHDLVKSGRFKAILVEPIEQSYIKLKEAYRGVPNVVTFRSAIGHEDGSTVIYKARESTNSLAPQWASFDRKHLLAHGVQPGNIEQVKVPVTTLQSLVSLFDIGSIDLLQVDTEGFDGEIVRMALHLAKVPLCIYFEHIHLAEKSRDMAFTELRNSGFVWAHDEWNTLALHPELIATWTNANTGSQVPGQLG